MRDSSQRRRTSGTVRREQLWESCAHCIGLDELSGLTFDMRGAQKAQPFGIPSMEGLGVAVCGSMDCLLPQRKRCLLNAAFCYFVDAEHFECSHAFMEISCD